MIQKNALLPVSVWGFEGKVGFSGCLHLSFGASVRDKGEQPSPVMVTVPWAICVLQTGWGASQNAHVQRGSQVQDNRSRT